MQVDTGLAIVIMAVLIFYLRLIVIQRERARRIRAYSEATARKGKTKSTTGGPRLGIVSERRIDRVIGGVGGLLVLIGALLSAGLIPAPALQSYWWVPTAAGIVAFSWMFKL